MPTTQQYMQMSDWLFEAMDKYQCIKNNMDRVHPATTARNTLDLSQLVLKISHYCDVFGMHYLRRCSLTLLSSLADVVHE